MKEPGIEDATRRTRLANERTYLAWWRTGLTALVVCIGVGRLVPAHTHVARWPYEAVGAGFGVLGLGLLWVGYRRTKAVEEALDRGEFAPLDARTQVLLLAAGLTLGAAVIALVLFG